MIRTAIVLTFTSCAALAFFNAQAADGPLNLLTNGHFQTRTSLQTLQTHTCNDASSAANWLTWIGGQGCIPDSGIELETDILFGPLPGGLLTAPTHVMHVRTEPVTASPLGFANQSGLVQVFSPPRSRVLASVWVYVVRGTVAMGVGNGGSTLASIPSGQATGQWRQLIGLSQGSSVNEFVLYGMDSAGSEFYADDAIVCPADTDLELTACQVYVGQSR